MFVLGCTVRAKRESVFEKMVVKATHALDSLEVVLTSDLEGHSTITALALYLALVVLIFSAQIGFSLGGFQSRPWLDKSLPSNALSGRSIFHTIPNCNAAPLRVWGGLFRL
jgi:hypothetical protein